MYVVFVDEWIVATTSKLEDAVAKADAWARHLPPTQETFVYHAGIRSYSTTGSDRRAPEVCESDVRAWHGDR